MDLVYSPFGSESNAYVNIVIDGLKMSGCNVLNLADLYKLRGNNPIPVILNWEDEVRGNDLPRIFWHFLKKKLLIWRIHSRGGHIVYVIHNRAPHDTNNSIALSLSLKVRRCLAISSSCIVVLCDETMHDLKSQLGTIDYEFVEPKIVKIPIPSYSGYYARSGKNWRSDMGIDANKFLFVFSGLIRPYKGVELIFDVADYFRSCGYDAEFLIAGRCDSSEYEQSLKTSLPNGGNVHLSFGFVKDDELGELVEASNALILPLDIRSSLNSSSCYLAFSYGRTVVCPLIGSLKEFDSGLFYTYEYRNISEHRKRIIAASERAYLDWKADPVAFANKGSRLKSIVDTECSVQRVGSLFRNAAEKSVEE